MESGQNETVYAVPQPSGFFASGMEKLYAVLSYPVAYLYIYWLFDITLEAPSYWWYLLGFAAAFCLGVAVMHRGRKAGWEPWAWLGAMALCFAGLLLGRSRVWEPELTALFLHGFAIYFTLSRSNTLLEGRTGRLFPLDCLYGAVIFPFGRFFLRIRVLVAILRDWTKTKKRTSVWAIVAIVVAILLFILSASLLSAADVQFGRLTERFLRTFDQIDVGIFIKFLLSLPVGAYLYGLVVGTNRVTPEAQKAKGQGVLNAFDQLRKVPAMVWVVLLAGFAILYGVFFGIQGSYLFGAFTRTLPDDFTVAEYARQGFFELCKVMALNFLLLWLALSSADVSVKVSRTLRVMATIVLAESLLLAVTAGSKLWLYIDCFGFTPLRLQSAWLICVLAAGCLASVWSIWTGRRSVRAWAMFSGLSLALLHLY